MQHGNSAAVLVNHHIKLFLNFLVSNILSLGPSHLAPSGAPIQPLQPTVMAAGALGVLLSVVTAPVFYSLAVGATITMLWNIQR